MDADYIIKNAEVVNGTGEKLFISDIAVKDSIIIDIGKDLEGKAKEIIDASGKIVTPGFIDCHNHCDILLGDVNHTKNIEPLIRQGITTIVGGNCGIGSAPISEKFKKDAVDYLELVSLNKIPENHIFSSLSSYMDFISKQGTVINCGFLSPYSMLRIVHVSNLLAS